MPMGAYRDLNEGLTAAVADYQALPDREDVSVKIEDDNHGLFDTLLPDFALLGPLNSEPHSLDKALVVPMQNNGKQQLTMKSANSKS